ncbi:hypothetical protein CO657_27635 (plasmid) [Rhizobium acidisoli]|uniref:Uncharacterized protein n=1 Tax=Rhizobium acidisoli TaxID=1538158 RepID=A0AAE5WSF7_9HYPH|nr:hypothetical protein [Rhizobium acidisoli]KPH06595.1 hypothetical protein AOG23_22445 [Rhizobium acidisoli]QAS81647.1 hypothetical protein CO657_27635 [Rhizobium acidisoli]
MTAARVFRGMGQLPAVAAIALAAALCSHVPADAAQWSQDPSSHCKFVAPVSLTSGPTFWIGACINGKASGEGMLRRRDGEQAGPAFFGRMKEGVPDIGVVDLPEGFRVGSFSGDDIGGQAESDPQDRINAFRIAAEAARQVSAQYATEKNAGSARHYEELAKTLEQQTD